MCSSYDKVLKVVKCLSDNITNHRDGTFCPSKLKKSIFTILAEDNCDLNAISSTPLMYYYGASITIMQFPQYEEFRRPTILSNKLGTKKVQSLLSSMFRLYQSIYLEDNCMRRNVQLQ